MGQIQQIIADDGSVVSVKPFVSGGNAAVNTGAADVTLKAAVAGKKIWVTWWSVTNITAGEYPVAELKDDQGTPVKYAQMAPNAAVATSKATQKMEFDPPIQIPAGQAVAYGLQTATGDCYSTVGGYVQV